MRTINSNLGGDSTIFIGTRIRWNNKLPAPAKGNLGKSEAGSLFLGGKGDGGESLIHASTVELVGHALYTSRSGLDRENFCPPTRRRKGGDEGRVVTECGLYPGHWLGHTLPRCPIVSTPRDALPVLIRFHARGRRVCNGNLFPCCERAGRLDRRVLQRHVKVPMRPHSLILTAD